MSAQRTIWIAFLRPAVLAGTALVLTGHAQSAGAQEADAHPGAPVYDRWCAQCHGDEGAGDGYAAAYMLPRPRDFTSGIYQIKTTPAGTLPTDDDILRMVDDGMPGTAMPGWEGTLSAQQRRDVVDYLKTFSRFFETEEPPDPLPTGGEPRVTDEGLAEGRVVYEQLECWRCHGQQGRGDGPSAFEQTDQDGFPIRTADLTQNWQFTGGGEVENIYRRMMIGVEGTPMPSQADAVQSGVVTEEQVWRVAQYVRSLSPEDTPRLREVARAALVEGSLPASAADSAWAVADEFFFPLAGQIIVPPRWFAPTVNGVWVQAVHNGEELALKFRWHDPSNSPDPTWLPWQENVLAAMQPAEGGPTAPQTLPDAFAVQFPTTIPEGMDRPYFLMGDTRQPVYLWQWESLGDGVTEALARGPGSTTPLAPEQQSVRAEASWEEGEWVLVVRRALAAPEGDALDFEAGRAIPMGFFAWDGDNSEAGTRGAISTWYYLYLDEPGSNAVFILPVTATLLTFFLGLAFVMRAQRRPRHAVKSDSSLS
ncbi:MAG: ethylbenzene dehydrogenase-related protein [Gemmatimonadota bacterium]